MSNTVNSVSTRNCRRPISLTLEGNAFSTNGNLDERAFPGVPPVTTELADHGFDVMGRWTRTHSERSQSSLQVYETNYSRSDTGMSENLHTLDLDFQNQFQAGSRNNIVWAAATASPATISSHRPRAG